MADQLPDAETLLPLVQRAQEGDTQAFEQVYELCITPVYRYVAFRVPAEVAEDLTADIFVKAWEKLHTYRPQKGISFASWLFRIARNTVIDSYRTHHAVDEMPEELVDDDRLNHTDTRLKRRETLVVVRAGLSQLPRRYREVLLLSFAADMPTSEIARTLRIREGTVRILKMRALKKLSDHLPPEFSQEV